jgi:two-component system OmpR family response regulator
MSRRVQLVDGDHASREQLRLQLTEDGFDVEEFGCGTAALERASAEPFDLIVLDLELPDLDGLTLCRVIRAHGVNAMTPILIITARGTESDKVLGLESGADEYLTKPVVPAELRATVRAILRRRTPEDHVAALPRRRIECHGLVLDPECRTAFVRGEPVALTKQEFDLLYLLAARPGVVFSRAALLSKIWGDEVCVTGRTVDAVVSRLRRKIERSARDPKLILTDWGVGYKFADAD